MTSVTTNHSSICWAAVFTGADQPLQLREFPKPIAQAGEALVRIECCTICGSDLHTITGKRKEPTPAILGHEILGVVEEVGKPPLTDISGVSLSVGDRVTWSVAVSCGSCKLCQTGYPQKCKTLSKYGHELAEGRTALSGGLAQFILLKAGSAVMKVSPSLPAEVICPVNCATATIAAAYRVTGDIDGKNVLIFGAGMLGLSAAALATSSGAASVTVCDINQERLKTAQQFGADHTVEAHADITILKQRLFESANLEQFDIILELLGAPAAISATAPLAAIGAHIVLVGSVMPVGLIGFDPEQIVRRWISIHGVHNYAPEDLQTAVAFLEQHHTAYPFAQLVERSFSLDTINEAVEYAVEHRPVRIAVKPIAGSQP
jgi:alcohol dehydrogenase